jgi:hypothetical protein
VYIIPSEPTSSFRLASTTKADIVSDPTLSSYASAFDYQRRFLTTATTTIPICIVN